MNIAVNISSVPLCTEETRKYLTKRFLIARTSPSTTYVDTEDNQRDLQQGAVIGVIASKFEMTYSQAKDLLKNISLMHWSGQDIYAPNKPVVVKQNHKYHLNLWKPSAIEANCEASAEPFIDHVKLALGNDAEVDFILDFIAFRYQHMKPKSKAHLALYLFSSEQGQGKSLLKDTLEKVFGRSAIKISTNVRELTGQNAYQFWSKTLLIVEEVKVGADTRLYDSIKAMSGADIMDADPKHKESKEVEIPAQLIMLSNRAPLFLEEQDRRFYVAEWDTGLRGTEKEDYFEGYINWLESGGYEAIAGLLNSRDLSNYRLSAHAPMTKAKEDCLDTLPLVVEELIEFLDGCPEALVFTNTDLKDYLSRMPAQSQSDYLERAGLNKGRKAITKSRPTLYWRKGCEVTKDTSGWVVIRDGHTFKLIEKIYLTNF
jgi:hypothetical protein